MNLNFKNEQCSTCDGDGKETCNNPDHNLIEAIGGETGRLGCPGCGHDPKHKIIGGGDCEDCNGTGQAPSEQGFEETVNIHMTCICDKDQGGHYGDCPEAYKDIILQAHQKAVTAAWNEAYDKGATDYHTQQLPVGITAAEVALKQSYEVKVEDLTKETLRVSSLIQAMKKVDELLGVRHFNGTMPSHNCDICRARKVIDAELKRREEG